jgi:ATP-binding cassette subfamily F protein 3
LLGLVCDSYWRVADGRLSPFDGDLDDYAAWLRGRGSEPVAGAVAAIQASARRDTAQTKSQRNELRRARQRMAEIEARLASCEQSRAEVEAVLADSAIYAGPADQLQSTLARQRELAEACVTLEAQWEACYAEVEALTQAEGAGR